MHQPNEDRDFQDCLDDLEKLLEEGVTGPSAPKTRFCPPKRLKDYFRNNNMLMIDKLLAKLYADRKTRPSSSRIVDDHVQAFATLLRIGEASYIQHFSQTMGLEDLRMPFTERPKRFPKSPGDSLWKEFWKEQWTFCPAIFKLEKNNEWEPERILPIVSKAPLGAGGSAETFRIEVPPCCNELNAPSSIEQVPIPITTVAFTKESALTNHNTGP